MSHTRTWAIPMLDRFGEEPHEPDELWAAEERRQAAAVEIAHCGLCDESGRRGHFVCDHVDRTGVAERGMQRVREAMGWDR